MRAQINHQQIKIRRKELLDRIREEPGITIPELGTIMGVSDYTIRNDLYSLMEMDKVRKQPKGKAKEGVQEWFNLTTI